MGGRYLREVETGKTSGLSALGERERPVTVKGVFLLHPQNPGV